MIKCRATSLKFSGDITFDLTLNPPYNGLYFEAPWERANLFRLQVYERVGKSVIAVYERNKRA